MADYIKREDARELFEMILESYKDAGIQNISMMVAIAPEEFHLSEDDEIADFNFELDGWRNNLMEIESADVAPVRHGHWIKISPAGIYECSECGKNVMTSDIEVYEYCHGCGARMDGDIDETDRR